MRDEQYIKYEEQLGESLLKIVMRGGFLSKYTCGMGKNKGSSMIIGGITDIGCGVCRSTNTRYSLELLNPNFH
jgi:hypothetical protein